MTMLLKPAPRTYSLQDYVEELTRRIYLMTEADPELRVKAAAILTSHVGGGDGPEEVGAQTRGQARRPNTAGGVKAYPDTPRVRVQDGPLSTGNPAAILAQDSPRGEPCGAKAPCGHPLTEDSRRLGKCWYCETPLERGGERA